MCGCALQAAWKSRVGWRQGGQRELPIPRSLSDCQGGKRAILLADRRLAIYVARLREKIIAVLWEDGFCDYLFKLLLLSLRCVAFALAVAHGRVGKGRFDDTQHHQDRETLCCSLLLSSRLLKLSPHTFPAERPTPATF